MVDQGLQPRLIRQQPGRLLFLAQQQLRLQVNRVRNMQKAAIQVMEEYGGKLPADYEELLKLKGIGSYTAGAIASIAYQIPVPAVDGNVFRILTRVAAAHPPGIPPMPPHPADAS
jgi:adenine-specific DNA glycosylase